MQLQLKKTYGTIFEEALLDEIMEVGTYKQVPEGTKLMEIGQYIQGMPLLISGAIKILRENTEGNELLLYYLEKGETCSTTLAYCMGQAKSEIRAIAEMETTLIMLPIRKMDEWTSKYRTWRDFVFASYHARLNELLNTIDRIAFNRMDERLAAYLKEKSRITQGNTIYNTHQEIAYDLNTSRVVISRLLKKLEQLSKIQLHRNHIEILDL